jgi:rhamnose utilization protein RhaD (predicted bifunctional aldolase and dehydrogenase)
MESKKLTELKDHSVFVGTNPDLVQASGGNTSWKKGSTIWVKGSGKCLKEAWSEEIFSLINFRSPSEGGLEFNQDFSKLSSNEIAPSIEVYFHILLKNDFVTHLHSLGSISLGISSEQTRLKFPSSGLTFVPYFRPGIDLAKAISSALDYQTNILLLQNHGVVFSGVSTQLIQANIADFESSVFKFFDSLDHKPDFPNWISILVSGVLTPDEAIFLGRKPFVESEVGLHDSIAINSMGELIFPNNLSDNRIEIAYFYVRVAKLIEGKTQVSYLSSSEVDALLDWDKEKFRIAMAN